MCGRVGALVPVPRFDDKRFRKATYSLSAGECIEAASADSSRHIGIRDSKDSRGEVLVITDQQWVSFISRIK